MLRAMSHPIKLVEVVTNLVGGKQTTQTRSLGEICIDDEKNHERRKKLARARAETHVGRGASNVSHADGGGFVVTFRKG